MATEVIECEFTRLCRLYEGLLQAVGLRLDEAALADHLGEDAEEAEQIRLLMGRSGEDDDLPEGDEVPGRVVEAMSGMEEAVAAELRGAAAGLGTDLPAGDELLAESLQALPEGDRDRLADALLLKGQGAFVRARYTDVPAFHASLAKHHDPECLAMVKLVPYLREQLRVRGFSVSDEAIEGFFDPAAQGSVPHCLKTIMASVNGQFSTGLIPLDDMVGEADPADWLEEARQKLLFRSHSAMHKAISEATSLKYDCVHKALSGNKKAKRIQAEIKYCLDRWLGEVEAGREPQIDDDYRGVPVEWTCSLLTQLEDAFQSKEEIYRVISEKTGIKAGSVRRYFQSNGQLKCAPLTVYRLARKLTSRSGTAAPVRRRPRATSYLADRETRQTAGRLATRVNAALRRWKEHTGDQELELEYRQLRLSLIVAIKEQQSTVPEEK